MKLTPRTVAACERLVLDPGPLAHRSGRQERGFRQVAVVEGGHVERAAARSHLRGGANRRTVTAGLAIGDDRRVRIELGWWRLVCPASPLVLIRAGCRRRLRQHAGERTSALDEDLAPHVLLHCLGRCDPRPAAFTPPRGARDRHFEAQLVGQRRGVLEGVLPFRRHEDQPLLHDLRRVQVRVEVLKARDAGSLHPFEVGLDAVLGDVAAHPVPPHARPGAVRRILEALKERVPLALGHSCPCAQHDRDSG